MRWRALVFGIASLAAVGVARAEVATYLPMDIAGSRSFSMGDAFRAVGTSNDAILENPAAMSLAPHYEIDGFFSYDTGSPATYWNGSIVDASTLPMATGIAYTHLGSGSDAGRFSGSSTTLALSYPISDVLFVGVSGDWLDIGLAHPTNAITGDAAIIFKPIEFLTLTGIGYNLIDIHSPLAPREVALAAAIGSDSSFHVAADVVGNLETPSLVLDYHLGGEYFLAQLFALRAGWMYDGLIEGHFLSTGVGLVLPSFGLDIGYRQQLIQWTDRAVIFSIKFFLPT